MKKYFNTTTLLVITFCICILPLHGQNSKDSTKVFKNTIRINLTNPMLFGNRNNIFGYERVLTDHQSFTVNVGRFLLPKLVNINTGSLELVNEQKEQGYTFAFDYRFYLRKENKYAAPRGVYVGPYYGFIHFQRDNTWHMNTATLVGDVNTNMRINMNMVGAQLGYQFIIKKRVAIDMILMGPGVWFYSLKTKLGTTLNPDDEALLFNKINELLAAKLPGHEIVIQPGTYENKGSVKATSAGFRYVVHVGFRF
jgi:hypothetical protein